MEFKYLDKEAYTKEDVKHILDEHFPYVKKQVKTKQEEKWSSKDVESKATIATLEGATKELESKIEELTKESESYANEKEALLKEITPIREKAKLDKFTPLLDELKVREDAREDFLKEVNLDELKDDVKEEEIKSLLTSTLKTKPYFKEVENQGLGKETLEEKNGESKEEEFTGKNVLISR